MYIYICILYIYRWGEPHSAGGYQVPNNRTHLLCYLCCRQLKGMKKCLSPIYVARGRRCGITWYYCHYWYLLALLIVIIRHAHTYVYIYMNRDYEYHHYHSTCLPGILWLAQSFSTDVLSAMFLLSQPNQPKKSPQWLPGPCHGAFLLGEMEYGGLAVAEVDIDSGC